MNSLFRCGVLGVVVLLLGLMPSVSGAAEPEPDAPVHLHHIARGETLIGLGRRYLADPRRWRELARASALRDPNRIAVGTTLRIPLRLMRVESLSASLESVVGEARGSAPEPLQSGQALAEGGEVNTGPDGHVTIRLVDGTVLRLRPGSRLLLRESRRVRDADVVRSGARLERGRVEIEAAPARAGRPGFNIDTPQGVLGVRGTEFRVASDVEQGVTRGEVLGGAVAFDGSGGGAAGRRVPAGYGTVIDVQGRVAPAVPLLEAPDVSGLPVLQEQILLRFALVPMEGAVAYRGQIARDARFDQVVADLQTTAAELRFSDLPDGDYVLRVRGIDARGLEGRDVDHRFRLKARPEPPMPSAPAPRAVLPAGRVEFAWAANREAQSYRLQLAGDAGFGAPLRDLGDLEALTTSIEGLVPGVYQWRLASMRAAGDQGPWGPARRLELRALPVTPQPAVGDRSVSFAWDGLPGQTFEFQLARDAAFADKIIERTLDQPGIDLPLPGTGRFHFRFRARDADGFVGPYTTPQHIDVPNCLRDSSGACVRVGDRTVNLAP